MDAIKRITQFSAFSLVPFALFSPFLTEQCFFTFFGVTVPLKNLKKAREWSTEKCTYAQVQVDSLKSIHGVGKIMNNESSYILKI